MLFITIYNNLCESRKQNKHLYKPFSGLHKHHIIPKHSGGSEEDSNFTYLTVHEHIIAHFLLWKIYKNPNDLRSMKMLGANLSIEYRKTIGYYCRDNKIGIFANSYKETHKEIARMCGLKSVENKSGIHTKNQELRAKWASLGGKKSAKNQMENNTGLYTLDKNLRKKWSSAGGKVSGKTPIWCNGEINKRSNERPGKEWFSGIIKRTLEGNMVIYNYEYIQKQKILKEQIKPKSRPKMWTNGSMNKRSHHKPGDDYFQGVTKNIKLLGK
jgi:hypothetical protein